MSDCKLLNRISYWDAALSFKSIHPCLKLFVEVFVEKSVDDWICAGTAHTDDMAHRIYQADGWGAEAVPFIAIPVSAIQGLVVVKQKD